MPVILALAAAAILGCVVLAALGRAGEMAAFPSDCSPLRLDDLTAADVALLRPPLALWGYNVSATEEALGVIARSDEQRAKSVALNAAAGGVAAAAAADLTTEAATAAAIRRRRAGTPGPGRAGPAG